MDSSALSLPGHIVTNHGTVTEGDWLRTSVIYFRSASYIALFNCKMLSEILLIIRDQIASMVVPNTVKRIMIFEPPSGSQDSIDNFKSYVANNHKITPKPIIEVYNNL